MRAAGNCRRLFCLSILPCCGVIAAGEFVCQLLRFQYFDLVTEFEEVVYRLPPGDHKFVDPIFPNRRKHGAQMEHPVIHLLTFFRKFDYDFCGKLLGVQIR